MTSTSLRQLVTSKRSSVSSALSQVIDKEGDWTTVNPRHILRALLRQCTYLPDSSARHYFRNHVVARFRKYDPRPPISSDLKLRLQQIKVRKDLIKKARKGLVFLERANNGYPRHLEKVLAMTYGRRGRRKRELLQRLMQDTPPRQELLKKLVPFPVRDAKPMFGAQLDALLKAQRRFEVHVKSEGSGKLRHSQRLGSMRPQIPQTNIWGRPMPMKRVNNLKAKWYAELLDTILPPLPKEEWERLRDLATGKKREGLVRRRKRAGMNETGFNDIPYAEPSSMLMSRPPSDTLEISKMERNRGVVTNPHWLTPRSMRRMWASIFGQCSYMTWDAVEKKWIVEWGGQPKKTDGVNIHAPPLNMSLFEGVDENGHVVSTQ